MMATHRLTAAHSKSEHLLGVGFTAGTAVGFVVGLLGGGPVGAHLGAAIGTCVGVAIDLIPTRRH